MHVIWHVCLDQNVLFIFTLFSCCFSNSQASSRGEYQFHLVESLSTRGSYSSDSFRKDPIRVSETPRLIVRRSNCYYILQSKSCYRSVSGLTGTGSSRWSGSLVPVLAGEVVHRSEPTGSPVWTGSPWRQQQYTHTDRGEVITNSRILVPLTDLWHLCLVALEKAGEPSHR